MVKYYVFSDDSCCGPFDSWEEAVTWAEGPQGPGKGQYKIERRYGAYE